MPVPYDVKSRLLLPEKYEVALAVWTHFIDHEANPRILIDAGSSAEMVAQVIPEKLHQMQSEGKKPVFPTVFTHNLAAWERLRNEINIDLYLMGGRYTVLSAHPGFIFSEFPDRGNSAAVVFGR